MKPLIKDKPISEEGHASSHHFSMVMKKKEHKQKQYLRAQLHRHQKLLLTHDSFKDELIRIGSLLDGEIKQAPEFSMNCSTSMIDLGPTLSNGPKRQKVTTVSAGTL